MNRDGKLDKDTSKLTEFTFEPAPTPKRSWFGRLFSRKSTAPSSPPNSDLTPVPGTPNSRTFVGHVPSAQHGGAADSKADTLAAASASGNESVKPKESQETKWWMPDNAVTHCYDCKVSFSTLRRRHHCRVCGQIFCHKCSDNHVRASFFGHRSEEIIRACNFCYFGRVSDLRSASALRPEAPEPAPAASSGQLSGGEDPPSTPLGMHSSDMFSPDPSGYRGSTSSDGERGSEGLLSLLGNRVLLSQSFRHSRDDSDEATDMNASGLFDSGDAAAPGRPLRRGLRRELESASSSGALSGEAVAGEDSSADSPERRLSHVMWSDDVVDSPKAGGIAGAVASRPQLWRSSLFEFHRSITQLKDDEDSEEEGDSDDDSTDTYAAQGMSQRPLSPSSAVSPRRRLPNRKIDLSGIDFPHDEAASKGTDLDERLRGHLLQQAKRHLGVMISQLLRDEGLSPDTWADIVQSFAMRSAAAIRLTTVKRDLMDIRAYVKVKTIPGGKPQDSFLVNGVAFTKNVAHRKMRSTLEGPKVLLLSCAIEFERVPGRLSQMDDLLQQEEQYLRILVSKIVALKPDLIMVEKSVSHVAMDLLVKAGVTVVSQVRRSQMQRLARFAGAELVNSTLKVVNSPTLGFVRHVYVKEFRGPWGMQRVMMFDGCPAKLGGTILLRGESKDNLRRVKRALCFALHVAHNLELERRVLFDTGLVCTCAPETSDTERALAAVKEDEEDNVEEDSDVDEAQSEASVTGGPISDLDTVAKVAPAVLVYMCRHWMGQESVLTMRLTCRALASCLHDVAACKVDPRRLCKVGKLGALQLSGLTVAEVRKDELLAWACRHGQLEVACWLVERFDITAEHARDELSRARELAGAEGHRSVVVWLDGLLEPKILGAEGDILTHERADLPQAPMPRVGSQALPPAADTSTPPTSKVPPKASEPAPKPKLTTSTAGTNGKAAKKKVDNESPLHVEAVFAASTRDTISNWDPTKLVSSSPSVRLPSPTSYIRGRSEQTQAIKLLLQRRSNVPNLTCSCFYRGDANAELGMVNFDYENVFRFINEKEIPLDCGADSQDPRDHQSLVYLHSMSSAEDGTQCIPFEYHLIHYYSTDDLTLWNFLQVFCFNARYKCKLPKVASMCVFNDMMRNDTLVHPKWTQRLFCVGLHVPRAKNSTTRVASEQTCRFSFGKFLELLFYADNLKCGKGHDWRIHGSTIFFYNGVLASFDYTSVQQCDVVFPPMREFQNPEIAQTLRDDEILRLSATITKTYEMLSDWMQRIPGGDEYEVDLGAERVMFFGALDDVVHKLASHPVSLNILKAALFVHTVSWSRLIQSMQRTNRALFELGPAPQQRSTLLPGRAGRSATHSADSDTTRSGDFVSPSVSRGHSRHPSDAADATALPTVPEEALLVDSSGPHSTTSASPASSADGSDSALSGPLPQVEGQVAAVRVTSVRGRSSSLHVPEASSLRSSQRSSNDSPPSSGRLSHRRQGSHDIPRSPTRHPSLQALESRAPVEWTNVVDKAVLTFLGEVGLGRTPTGTALVDCLDKEMLLSRSTATSDRKERKDRKKRKERKKDDNEVVREIATALCPPGSSKSNSLAALLRKKAFPTIPGVYGFMVLVYDSEPSSILAHILSCRKYHGKFERLFGEDLARNPSLSPAEKGRIIEANLLSEDKSHIQVETTSCNQGVTMTCEVTVYYPLQFAALRKLYCDGDMDYVRSLSQCKAWAAEGGKSGSAFSKTLDDRFVLKQVSSVELGFLNVAPLYFEYLCGSYYSQIPTMLAKIFGVYSIHYRTSSGVVFKQDMIVMENVLYNRDLGHNGFVFDLKGSVRNRLAKHSGVLQDENLRLMLYSSPFCVDDRAKAVFGLSVWNDALFLSELNVMDYSILVAIDGNRDQMVVGIIDYMRQYTWDKHLETYVKSTPGFLAGTGKKPTVISPKQYKIRFRDAIWFYFPMCPTKHTRVFLLEGDEEDEEPPIIVNYSE